MQLRRKQDMREPQRVHTVVEGSVDMTPYLAQHDPRNNGLYHTIRLCQTDLGHSITRISSSNFADLVFGQFCLGTLFSNQGIAGHAALARRISHVLLMCSKKKVLRPYTTWIVATMKNPHAFGNLSVMNSPRKVRGANSLAFTSSLINTSVPMTLCSCPNPASSKMRPMGRSRTVLINSLPEPDFDRLYFGGNEFGPSFKSALVAAETALIEFLKSFLLLMTVWFAAMQAGFDNIASRHVGLPNSSILSRAVRGA
jgi:hypothetical protein